MSLRDFIGERRSVSHAGRRFIVRRPTVRTLFLGLECFGTEIGIVRSAVRESKGELSASAAISAFLLEPGHARLARVLDTFVEVENGIEGDLARLLSTGTDLALALVSTAAEMIDLPAVDRMLCPPEESGHPEPDGDEPPNELLTIFALAERFKISPMEIREWPVGIFANAVAALSRPPRDPAEQSGLVLEGTSRFTAGQRIGE